VVVSRLFVDAAEKTNGVIGEALANLVVEVADLVRSSFSELNCFVGEQRRGQDRDVGLKRTDLAYRFEIRCVVAHRQDHDVDLGM
jgi:hypothetical protein